MAVLNDFLKTKKAKECSICQSFRNIFWVFLNFFVSISRKKFKKRRRRKKNNYIAMIEMKCTKYYFLCL